MDHRSWNIHRLDPLSYFGQLLRGILCPDTAALQGIVKHKTSDNCQHSHEAHTDIEIRPCISEGRFDFLLDACSVKDSGFRRDTQNNTELDVDLPVLCAFNGADKRFREFMAHVAGDGNETRNTETHHGRSENKSTARTDESAYKPAYKSHQKEIKNVHSIKRNKISCLQRYIMH